MSLKTQIEQDLKDAMRARDEVRRSALRLLVSAIRYSEVELGKPLDDEGVQRVVGKQVKQRRESIAEFSRGHRQDLVDREQAELDILLAYAPQQLSREEITASIVKIVDEIAPSSSADLGKIMARAMAELKGRADGKEVNAIAREVLDHKLTGN